MATYLKCKIQHNNYNKIFTEDNIIQSVIPGKIVNNNLLLFDDKLEIKLNGHNYQRNLLYLENEILFNRIRKYWKCIEHLLLTGNGTINNIVNLKEVVNLLCYTYYNLQESRDKELQTETLKCVDLFKNSVCKISEIDEDILNRLASNVIVLQEEPISQYFHGYFMIFYLILLIEKVCGCDNYETTYKSIILDLLKLSEIIFEKHKNDLLYAQPFPCMCIKNLWIYLMKYKSTSIRTFWGMFNKCIEERNEEFAAWTLRHLSYVQYYTIDESIGNRVIREDSMNIELINKLVQSTISQIYNESKLLSILKLLNPMFTELWIEHMKLEPYQIMWEHFYKNINNTIQNILLPKEIFEFKDNIDNITNNPDSLRNPYEYFLYLLHRHLNKHPFHWKKLQGRIYSRLPEQKVREFNDNGVYNISLLFFTLGSLKIQEILEKLNGILGILSRERQNKEFIWILHINMVIMAIFQNHDVSIISTTLLKLVQNASENRDNFHLIKHYLQGLSIIFNNTDTLDLKQNCLLSSWIAPYMLACSHTDLCMLLQLLIDVLKKAESVGKWSYFRPIYVEFVIPTLKQIAVTNSTGQIGKLAGLLLINMPELNSSLLQYFCNENINVNVTNEFLTTLLENMNITSITGQQDNILISAWCRISLLCSDTISNDLSQKIFSLPAIRNLVLIESFDEPFVDFIKALNKQISQPNIFRLKELCEACFGNIDKWIVSHLTPSKLDSQVLYLYTKISLLFYYCAPLLYQKSKSFCLLNRLITVLLLPTEVLTGKSPPGNILNAVEKTWHLFFKGIYKLDHVSDPYIDRTLKDLIVRYIPHFSTVNSPIINILDNNEITTYTLEKITNNLLLHSARSSEENTFKAIKTIQNILQISVDLERIQSVIKKVLPGIFEVIIFNSQKSAALDVLKFITSSEWYNHVHDDVRNSIQNVTAKHLAFNTNNYFQLISILQKYMPEDVKASLPQIKEQIVHVERMRGIGFDNTLRQALKRIEDAC
ncbi:protein mms22-like [Holotrichia oblita]|uniref:Protein mms22-like n=1 Tax=Holotrichia oblita TaxID=644536 RepID=A0ACB9TSV3_HOLOL|nr:protein mms22-like [Holotrichia oblita]